MQRLSLNGENRGELSYLRYLLPHVRKIPLTVVLFYRDFSCSKLPAAKHTDRGSEKLN